MKQPILGSHVGMSKANKHGAYLVGSVQEALSYGANTFMIFTGPPQSTVRTPVTQLEVKEMHALLAQHAIRPEHLIVHAPYLINIANPVNHSTWEFGVRMLIEEVKRCEAIGINLLVLHPGARLKGEYQAALDALVKGLNAVAPYQSNVVIALETMSGKGSEVGIDLQDFQYVLSQVTYPDKVGVCLDTCHMHDAGYDLSTWAQVKTTINQTVGQAKIMCFHINDSKNPQSARKDRHENIGYGYIGFENLCAIVWDTDYLAIPKVLETPYHDNKPPYEAEIKNFLTKAFTIKIKD